MKSKILTIILFACLTFSVSAQDEGERRSGREQRERGPRGPARMLDRIPEELGLDDEQRAQWEAAIAEHRTQMETRFTRMRELRQARRDGDDARAAELEEQMAGDAWDPMESVQQSLEAIKPSLNADQLERLSGMTERMQQRRQAFADRGEDGTWGGGRGPDRMLERMADTLDLNDEQRAGFDEIVAGHRERMQQVGPISRDLRRAQRDGDSQRVEELRAQLQQLGVDPQESLEQAMNEIESILEEPQAERFSEMRRTMAQRNQRRTFFQQAEYELPEALGLDQEQRAQYDDLLRDRRQGLRSQWEQLRGLRRELREAREAGDEARVEALQLELEMSQPNQDDERTEFLDGLRGMLRQDQLPLLDRFYPNVVVMGTKAADVRDVLRAALRAGLDREQRAAWREIMREAMKSIHELRGKDKEAEATVAAETRKKVEAILSETQLARFAKELDHLRRSPKRR